MAKHTMKAKKGGMSCKGGMGHKKHTMKIKKGGMSCNGGMYHKGGMDHKKGGMYYKGGMHHKMGGMDHKKYHMKGGMADGVDCSTRPGDKVMCAREFVAKQPDHDEMVKAFLAGPEAAEGAVVKAVGEPVKTAEDLGADIEGAGKGVMSAIRKMFGGKKRTAKKHHKGGKKHTAKKHTKKHTKKHNKKGGSYDPLNCQGSQCYYGRP